MNKAIISRLPVRRVPRADVIQVDPDGRKRPQDPELTGWIAAVLFSD